MQKIEINPFDLSIHPHHLFDRQSLLLAAGDFAQDDFNVMTIGWGSIGTMWNKPSSLWKNMKISPSALFRASINGRSPTWALAQGEIATSWLKPT